MMPRFVPFKGVKGKTSFLEANMKIRQTWVVFKKALDFDLRVILSFHSPFSTLQFCLKIKYFTELNMFYNRAGAILIFVFDLPNHLTIAVGTQGEVTYKISAF